MPFLRIQTNKPLPETDARALAASASRLPATATISPRIGVSAAVSCSITRRAAMAPAGPVRGCCS